ncbi:MAG TPA: quinone-dependent dihydroorotate dehydrogenase [Oligoflexia bacterium]|nr:quinone-dependent dihydroorotate dehydrogenase [Oligoflexia bacterium]HMP48627.1 quinone-dependent dihydroorotate dehydrogenase [Oligoflexia bacterium]
MSIYEAIKPLLFKLDPERAHHLALYALKSFDYIPGFQSILSSVCKYPSSRLSQTLWGIEFPNPIGLAAGFDKNAFLSKGMASLGFGFLELGSVTNKPSNGNARPRMFRLPQDYALVNRMGLNNVGPYQFLKNYHSASANTSSARKLPPRLINIAKTNDMKIVGDDAVKDMVDCFRIVGSSADIIVFNLSCPNSGDGRTFEEPESLPSLLAAINKASEQEELKVPILAKFSNDIDLESLKKIADICLRFGIAGFVMGNTSVSRSNLITDKQRLEEIGMGGLSGRPVFERALERVSALRTYTGGSVPLIGVGGIGTSDQVVSMLQAGASLVELYTALIYRGPLLVRELLEGLERKLLKDELMSVSDLIGRAD